MGVFAAVEDGRGFEKRFRLILADDGEAVGLVLVRGDLGDHFVGPDPCRSREPLVRADGIFDGPADFFRLLIGTGEAQVRIGLVDPRFLDRRRTSSCPRSGTGRGDGPVGAPPLSRHCFPHPLPHETRLCGKRLKQK